MRTIDAFVAPSTTSRLTSSFAGLSSATTGDGRVSGGLDVRLVGDGLGVACVDGIERTYLSLDAAASTGALPAVASRVQSFLPW